jgi:ribosomal protein L37AE/L43A
MYLNNPILILPCCNSYQFAVKRKAVGIWGCKDCGKVKAGGAYTMKYVIISSLIL